MRKLTAKQKKVIDRFMLDNTGARTWDDLSLEVIETLIAINDTEILYQTTNAYMHDKTWSEINA